jgi:hypothetical protein
MNFQGLKEHRTGNGPRRGVTHKMILKDVKDKGGSEGGLNHETLLRGLFPCLPRIIDERTCLETEKGFSITMWGTVP